MPCNQRSSSRWLALAALGLGAAGAWAQSGPAAVVPGAEGAPGERYQGPVVRTETHTVAGTVTGVVPAGRRLFARTDDGRELVLSVAPEVQSFERLKVGDRVQLRYTEARALTLVKRAAERNPRDDVRSTVESAALSLPGEGAARPEVGATERVTVVADVHAVDRERGTVTLRGTSGEPVAVRADPQTLRQIGPNDQVVISYVQATALSVEPQDAASAVPPGAPPAGTGPDDPRDAAPPLGMPAR